MSDVANITIRANLHLWLLTGRSDDFFNEALNTGVRYSVADTPPEVTAARQLLKLQTWPSDFHVLSVLAATKMSTTFVRTLPDENDAVFIPGFLSLPPVSASRPLLPPSGHSWPSIDGGRAGLDGFSQVVIRSLGGSVATITTDTGAQDSSDYALVPLGGGGFILHVSKAEEYGIRANFEVPTWNVGDEVVVNFSPTRYPYQLVAERILLNSVVRRLMTSEGVMAAFAETSSSALKVGLLGLAIIRRMTRYINSGQSGFSVTSSFDAESAEPLQKRYSLDPMFSASLSTPVVDQELPEGFYV